MPDLVSEQLIALQRQLISIHQSEAAQMKRVITLQAEMIENLEKVIATLELQQTLSPAALFRRQ